MQKKSIFAHCYVLYGNFKEAKEFKATSISLVGFVPKMHDDFNPEYRSTYTHINCLEGLLPFHVFFICFCNFCLGSS